MFDQEYISNGTIQPKGWAWLQMKEANLDDETIKAYEQALNPDMPFGERVKNFLTAQNKAGRKAKIIKDFALFFVPWPWSTGIKNLTELATHIMKDEQKDPKPAVKSKTVITFGLLFLASLLQATGVIDVSAMGLEISPDAAWVVNISSIVGIILRAVTDKPVKLK